MRDIPCATFGITLAAMSRKKGAPPVPPSQPQPQREPTMATASTPGQRIRAARLAKGWNTAQLVRALGVARSTVEAWEADAVKSMEFENLEALSVVLGVPTSWILEGEGQTVTEPQFQAWKEFLASTAGKTMTTPERTTLASIKFQPPMDATAETYHALLIALRMGQKN